MSLLRVLQSELKNLANEASKKKLNHVKEAADHCATQLTTLQHRIKGEDNANIAKGKLHFKNLLLVLRSNEEIIKPFLLACDCKTPKLIVIALSSLQQLLQHAAIPIVC